MKASTHIVELASVGRLHPIEGHSKKRVVWLREKIEEEGVWNVPLRIERDKFLIMDGHHRFEVARLLGLKRVPAILHNYSEVEVYSLRQHITVTEQVILDNFGCKKIFPYKTAKHIFPEQNYVFGGVSLHELY